MNDDITILADFDSALYEQVEPPLVSLYLPTHGSAPGDESDRIEFEALVEQARAKLAQERERREYKGVDERLAYAAEHFDDLMSPAPGGSLAVLAGNDRTYIYRLGYEAGPLAFVGERFYVKPLLKNFSSDRTTSYWGFRPTASRSSTATSARSSAWSCPATCSTRSARSSRSCTTGTRVRWTTRRSRTICRPTTAGSRATT